MTTSSLSTDARARKNEAVLRKAIAEIGQNKVAEEIGVSPTTVSRNLSDEEGLARFCKIAASVGVKCVPSGYECYPKPELEAIFRLARGRMMSMESVDQLMWDDE